MSVNYIDSNGKEKTTLANIISDSSTILNTGWYAVHSDIEIDSRITCKGDVHLILCDGCTLTVPNGITVNENEATLTIYGQKDGTGKVDAGSQSASWAAIGGTSNNCGGLITINGGTVIAKGNYAGAGIGGGQRHAGTAKIVINGGTVNATDSTYGAGIGGGARGSADITINGGNISVSGRMGYGGAGSPSADIRLSWKNLTDSITAGSYAGKVTLEKNFTDGSNIFTIGEVSSNSSINGKTLIPAEKATFTVTWMNGDKVLETDENVPFGTVPEYNGKEPEKISDDKYDYTFSGWTPEISKVTGNAIYKAQFSSKPHTYGEPTWTWSDDHSSATAVFSCTGCEYQETIEAVITKTEETNRIIYTATVEFDGKTYTDTYTEEKPHIHTYGEPTWNWSEDHSSATAVFSCNGCEYQETIEAVITMTEETNRIIYTATVEFGGKTYTDTYTEAKEETYVYYPAAKPYIDDEGAYILGYKEHYRYKGKYYAVNSDKSVGDEITDIWISYFKFALLPDNTYAIEYYTGATKNLTEIVIPKTFNGRKITTLGTDNLDVFIKAGKPQFELVLNENITEIKSCAFNKIGVTKVTGDTSGLNKIGEYAFSWANKAGGYTLDITFAYPGTITTGDAIFNHVNAVLHLGHGTTFSNMDFRATSLTYDFNDAHTYGEPTWEWSEDYLFATATFTCTHPGCGHQEETDFSEPVKTEQPDGQILLSEKVTFNGKDYYAPKPVYRTEVGEYIVEVTGFYRGYIGNPKENIEGINKLTVRFMDKNGNEVTAPQYIWTAKETAEEGIVLESNGDIIFTESGDFHVQLRSPDGETVYSSWIPIRSPFLGGDGFVDDDSEKSSPDKEKTVPHTNGETINSPRIPVELHSGSDQTNVSSQNELDTDPDMPKTGDAASAAAVSAILLTSLTAALFLAMKRKKDEEA